MDVKRKNRGNNRGIKKKKAFKTLILKALQILKVRIIGLEPTRLAAPDPKSGMSTNFTISADISSLYLNFDEAIGDLSFVGANISITSNLQRFF